MSATRDASAQPSASRPRRIGRSALGDDFTPDLVRMEESRRATGMRERPAVAGRSGSAAP